MDCIRSLIAIVLAIFSLLGILLGSLGLAVLFFVDLPGLATIPATSRVGFVCFALFFLLISWILFFCERRIMVGQLEARLHRRRELQAAIDGLSTLRSEGINNLYAFVPPANEFDVWVAHYEDWHQRVIDYMKPKFTAAIVGLFSELGAVPAISFSHASMDPKISAKHKRYLRMIAKQLAVLERVIQQGSYLVHEPKTTIWESL